MPRNKGKLAPKSLSNEEISQILKLVDSLPRHQKEYPSLSDKAKDKLSRLCFAYMRRAVMHIQHLEKENKAYATAFHNNYLDR